MARKNSTAKLLQQADTNVVQIKKQQSLTLRLDDMKTIEPLTRNQALFFDLFKRQHKMIALYGEAGTGKTFIAFYKALELVMDKSTQQRKVAIVRSSVQARDMGFMPGTEEEKMQYYEKPYEVMANSLFSRGDAYSRLKEQGHIEFYSTAFMRGTTLDNTVIIVDEMQNMNKEELNTLMTRVGENSVIILCGDFAQNDLVRSRNDKSGIWYFFSVAQRMPSFKSVKFEIEDIVRSGLVKEWIIASREVADLATA